MNKIHPNSWQRHYRRLLYSILGVVLALAVIGFAGMILGEGLLAEAVALFGVALAAVSTGIGLFAFVMLIYLRIRQVLNKDPE